MCGLGLEINGKEFHGIASQLGYKPKYAPKSKVKGFTFFFFTRGVVGVVERLLSLHRVPNLIPRAVQTLSGDRGL